MRSISIFKPVKAGAGLLGLAAAAMASAGAAEAADLSSPPMGGPPQDYAFMPAPNGYGGFNPLFDPRCRIVPQPQASLYGETARFLPTAVCQSRGLYADSVLFP
ncbi:MAG TPA: hypothetical protein VFF88_07140 [Methylocella sp.]|nr:hypothetical protein [Methylocella sp.]